MIYRRCFFLEFVLVAIERVLDLLDRRGLGMTRLYGVAERAYRRAWSTLWEARPDLEAKLCDRFPTV